MLFLFAHPCPLQVTDDNVDTFKRYAKKKDWGALIDYTFDFIDDVDMQLQEVKHPYTKLKGQASRVGPVGLHFSVW